MKSVAIIGTGIAGLGCAYHLQNKYKLTVFEQNSYVGGHTNTVEILENGHNIPIDTGFMVFNTTTYPELTRLFSKLEVPLKETDMSFSVQIRSKKEDIEWCGSSLNQLFGQRKNIFNLRFLRMILDLNRFNQMAEKDIDASYLTDMTIADYVKRNKLCTDLLYFYLIPMASAIWSSPPESMTGFPAQTLLRFFHNHRLNAGLNKHLNWLTVDGGAKEYIARLINSFSNYIKLNQQVISLQHTEKGVVLKTAKNEISQFDFVIVATHANQALAILDKPSDLETSILSKFKYSSNSVLLHTDEHVMPSTRRCWASWNYRMDQIDAIPRHSVHYWMNNLQQVSNTFNYFVSLNSDFLVDAKKILKRINYEHPTFDVASVKAQNTIQQINKQDGQRIYFCGSYFRYGFHEDALNSAYELCQLIDKNENN